MYYTQEAAQNLKNELIEVRKKYRGLLERFVRYEFECSKAEEYATHGYGRRLSVMVRCIENVYEMLPPDFSGIPDEDELTDVTINLHAFIQSTFGCCDNLAWIWVHERSIFYEDGSPPNPRDVGLRTKFLLKSMPETLKSYLDTKKDWYLRLKNHRDALSHRIPIYIPPHIVSNEFESEYQKLGIASFDALSLGDFEEYNKLEEKQKELTYFSPLFTHSFVEKSDFVFFHLQLLEDFNTIQGISEKILEEIRRC